MPQPALHADGNAILFHRSDDAYAELEFVGTTIECLARRGNREWSSKFQVGAPLPAARSEMGFLIQQTLPIEGKKPKEAAAKESAARPQRKSA
jgi:hypothetical protein